MRLGTHSRRWRILPARGRAIVSTDIHGNYEDFARLRELFEEGLAESPDTHWVILGDLVHGPSPQARRAIESLFDFSDDSGRIVEETYLLCREYPNRVHFVLGNHDYAHIGGPATRKFYDDEAAHLDARLTDGQREAMQALFRNALLAVMTPCGAFLCHGAPGLEMSCIEELDDIDFPPRSNPRHEEILRHFLACYGQQREAAGRFLDSVTRDDAPARFVIHGHDKDDTGWFVEGGNQLCPTIFGATRELKRYVVLDLEANYDSVSAIRDGHELLLLYG